MGPSPQHSRSLPAEETVPPVSAVPAVSTAPLIRPKRAHRARRANPLAAVPAQVRSANRAWSTTQQPRGLVELGPINIVLQPIVNVTTGIVYATEALARFPQHPNTPVDALFCSAHAAGWGAELEAACLRLALRRREDLPESVILSVNVSPDALKHGEIQDALHTDLQGIAVEITEKSATDSDALLAAMNDIRRRGGLIAIDDAGTGYAGLLRLSALRPDIVKLDRGLVTGARHNDVQAVVIEALVSLSRRIGAHTLGEGVESIDDLTMLAELDVDLAQGWAIGRPATEFSLELAHVAAACRNARRGLMDASAGFENELHGTAAITAALAGSNAPADIRTALSAASAELGVDVVGLSTLTGNGVLREITTTGADVDTYEYRVDEYPATAAALREGTMVEAHVDDPHSDPAERALLARDGLASVLVTPVVDEGTPLGILEFSSYTHRRWTRRDLQQARTVAEHLAGTLRRLGDTVV